VRTSKDDADDLIFLPEVNNSLTDRKSLSNRHAHRMSENYRNRLEVNYA